MAGLGLPLLLTSHLPEVLTGMILVEIGTFFAQAAATGKPAPVIEKIVEGKMAKFYEEVCLYEQPFIKDQTVSISQLIATKIGKLSENISVRRFARFKVGDVGETIAVSKPEQKAE